MFRLLLFTCCSVCSLRVSSSLVHGHLELDESLAEENRPRTSYSSEPERSSAADPERLSALINMDSAENHFMMETGIYDEGRSMRSPRRCIPHQQSCLGYPLPCCDACDTCYCRFFNAICYCRRVGHTCPSRRT
ncbi:agouti-related protein [Gouania willdenowi]|uniref:Agouti-related protein n=1 Tax=Gouania willdenowi TaxID=441366 RepID=A0A8C5H1S8_GOUWI|nr:agouti-signaling protein-like [Gouania willdenowi]XP_028297849.1 agouti-signaling protein-like [Gouania willdenowi]